MIFLGVNIGMRDPFEMLIFLVPGLKDNYSIGATYNHSTEKRNYYIVLINIYTKLSQQKLTKFNYFLYRD